MRRSSHSRRELSARRSCAICATSPRASGAKTSFSSSLPHSSGGKAVRACSRARDACAGSASSRASSLAAPAGWAKPIGRWLSPAKADAPRLLVRMTAAPEKSIRRPRPSVSCPSSRTWSSSCRTARCAFSASSRSTTQAGLRRTASVSRPPSPYPTYPGGAPTSRAAECASEYSDRSTRTRAPSKSSSACARARQVDRRERLVRQAPVANVPRGELRGRVQRLGKEPHAMMLLVLRGRSAEDPRRVRRRRLAHQHRNEAPFQRRIRLEVLLELVVRRGADAGKLAARERRLQLIGRILRSLAGGSGADQHVKLVDEDDEAAVGALHLVLDPDQAFAERAAQLRSGHQATHVELEENAVAAEHAQREAFDDGGLANPGLAD